MYLYNLPLRIGQRRERTRSDRRNDGSSTSTRSVSFVPRVPQKKMRSLCNPKRSVLGPPEHPLWPSRCFLNREDRTDRQSLSLRYKVSTRHSSRLKSLTLLRLCPLKHPRRCRMRRRV